MFPSYSDEILYVTHKYTMRSSIVEANVKEGQTWITDFTKHKNPEILVKYIISPSMNRRIAKILYFVCIIDSKIF